MATNTLIKESRHPKVLAALVAVFGLVLGTLGIAGFSLAQAAGNTIYVGSGGQTPEDGSRTNPYSDFEVALERAQAGDIIELTSNLTRTTDTDLIIGKDITVNGASFSLRLRGADLVLGADTQWRNINLVFLKDGSKQPTIYVSDYSVEFDGVDTLVGPQQPNDRPTLVAGTKGNVPAGTGANIRIENGANTIFKQIVLGSKDAVKDTPTTLVAGEAKVLEPLVLSGINSDGSYAEHTGEVRATIPRTMNTVLGAESALNATVIYAENQNVYGASLDGLTNLVVSAGANVAVDANFRGLSGILEVQEGATFTANEIAELSLDGVKGTGKVKLVAPLNTCEIYTTIAGSPTLEFALKRDVDPATLVDQVLCTVPADTGSATFTLSSLAFDTSGYQLVNKNGMLTVERKTATPEDPAATPDNGGEAGDNTNAGGAGSGEATGGNEAGTGAGSETGTGGAGDTGVGNETGTGDTNAGGASDTGAGSGEATGGSEAGTGTGSETGTGNETGTGDTNAGGTGSGEATGGNEAGTGAGTETGAGNETGAGDTNAGGAGDTGAGSGEAAGGSETGVGEGTGTGSETGTGDTNAGGTGSGEATGGSETGTGAGSETGVGNGTGAGSETGTGDADTSAENTLNSTVEVTAPKPAVTGVAANVVNAVKQLANTGAAAIFGGILVTALLTAGIVALRLRRRHAN